MFARIDDDGFVVELLDVDELPEFHPDVAKLYKKVPAGKTVEPGHVFKNKKFSAPAKISPTADDVRAESMRRILLVCPGWVEAAELNARGFELLRIGESNWTADQLVEADALQALWDWIKSVRDASDVLEAEPPDDYRDDSHWPAPL